MVNATGRMILTGIVFNSSGVLFSDIDMQISIINAASCVKKLLYLAGMDSDPAQAAA